MRPLMTTGGGRGAVDGLEASPMTAATWGCCPGTAAPWRVAAQSPDPSEPPVSSSATAGRVSEKLQDAAHPIELAIAATGAQSDEQQAVEN